MATDNNGLNQLKRDKNSFMTDEFRIDKNLSFHDTFRFDQQGNIIGKPHTTVSFDGITKRTNLPKR